MSKFRVAVIGCGRIGTEHLKAYALDPRVEIVGMCDIVEGKAEKLAADNKLATPKFFADYKQMIAELKPDLVSVALWTHLHLPVVRDLCALGVRAVHCEKPVAGTYGEVQEMAKLAAQAKTRLTFNHQRRFASTFVRARELLFSGTFGGLQRIEIFNPDNILDWGTHMMDLMHMYNREVGAKWVIGQLDARAPHQWFNIPFEHAFFGQVRFHNNVRAVIFSGDDKEIGCGLRLVCSNGIIELTSEEVVRSMHYGEGKWLEERSTRDSFASGFQGVMRHLIDTLETGEEPAVIWHRAVKAVELSYALYESSRRRARIDLPLTGVTDHPFVTMLNEGVVGPAKPEPAKVAK